MITKIGSFDLSPFIVDSVELYAPEEFWDLPDECKKKLGWNCGPGKFGGKVIPNTVWGLSIKIACEIHDCMYFLGKTQYDKWISDVTFLTNMNDMVESGTMILRAIRRYRVMTYFSAVRDCGDSSFWKGKVRPNETT
jgi:hypothetical protein